MSDPGPAILFDIDGTLVDTNYFHTLAWWRALRDAGEDIPMAEIHPLIGMGSDKMLDRLFGEERPGMSDAHSAQFEPFRREIRAGEEITDLIHGGLVAASKPAPDIFQTALDKLGLDPGRTMVVGDTRWDLEAASSAGLDCVGVLTGGTTRNHLEEAGAVAVYRNVAELLSELDASPLARLVERR
ncbi:MAG: HAD family hydrolase [Actinomycetota bacterium]|nr:HAD family hydrolase [Actinomycetota bacterium]